MSFSNAPPTVGSTIQLTWGEIKTKNVFYYFHVNIYTLHMLVNFVLCFVLYADNESRSKFNARHNGDSMSDDASVNPGICLDTFEAELPNLTW